MYCNGAVFCIRMILEQLKYAIEALFFESMSIQFQVITTF